METTIAKIDTPQKADALMSGLTFAMQARINSELAARKVVLKTIYKSYFDGNETYATAYNKIDAIHQIISADRDDSDGEGAYEVKKSYDNVTDVITVHMDGSVTEQRIDLANDADVEVRRLNREYEQEKRDEEAHREYLTWLQR